MTRKEVRPRAWVLNLDVEHELENPGARTSPAWVHARVQSLEPWLRRTLLSSDDLILPHEGISVLPREASAYDGVAWCPTPKALSIMQRHGITPASTPPSWTTLSRVNHRAFCASLAQTLPRAAFVHTLTELREVISRSSPSGRWVLKRPFGFAGRGRCIVSKAPHIDAAETRWITRSLTSGSGLQVEPWVSRTLDLALHGFIHPNNHIELGELTVQHCDQHGAWETTRPLADPALHASLTPCFLSRATEVAHALIAACYHGPFGIDGFLWRDENDKTHVQSLSEINARYSMGWGVGMRPIR